MTATIDETRLHEFVGTLLGELGAATSVPLVRLGDRLGLYRALHAAGPMTALELAAATGTVERYVREWLCAQAASGYLTLLDDGRFELPPEHAMVFAEEESPASLMGAFDLVKSMLDAEEKVERAFRTGEGVAWGDLGGCLFCAAGRFFRPGYIHNLVSAWLPALDGMVERLEAGATVADVGCGCGFSTILMAEAFPNSRFVGVDFHAPSIEDARRHAAEHGLSDRLRFEVATAKELPADGFDLVTCFDCLHDMGDPRGAAAHIRSVLKPDGAWMVVEPMAGDSVRENFNPVGRLYYNASTMICVPTSLDQEVGTALGAQAGEAVLSEVIRDGGFSRVRRATEGPFNLVLEARP